MTETIPATPFEEAIARGINHEETLAEVLGKFWNESLVVPSGGDMSRDSSQFQPILFARDSDQMMAVFTDFARISGDVSSKAPFAIRLSGQDLLSGLQPGVGLVINPGSTLGFETLPSSVSSIINTFGATPPAAS